MLNWSARERSWADAELALDKLSGEEEAGGNMAKSLIRFVTRAGDYTS